MKKTLGIFLFAILCGTHSYGQVVNEEEIIGIWSVVQVNYLSELPDDQKPKLDMLANSFLKSSFEFKNDKNFSFDFDFEDMRITQAHWKFDSSSNSYKIQEWKDKDTNKWLLMEIYAKNENGKTYFFLSESFLALEMKKKELTTTANTR